MPLRMTSASAYPQTCICLGNPAAGAAVAAPAEISCPVWGHEERFPPTRLSAGYGFRKETIAGMRRNERDAPISAVRVRTFGRFLSTPNDHLPDARHPRCDGHSGHCGADEPAVKSTVTATGDLMRVSSKKALC
jgi:hypothetical protein